MTPEMIAALRDFHARLTEAGAPALEYPELEQVFRRIMALEFPYTAGLVEVVQGLHRDEQRMCYVLHDDVKAAMSTGAQLAFTLAQANQ